MFKYTGRMLAIILAGITVLALSAPAAPAGSQASGSRVRVKAGATPGSTPPSAPFRQCPAIGADTSCAILLYIDTDGSLKALTDPSQGPYDGEDDTLVGIVNNSSKTVDKIVLRSSQAVFGFDGDGFCGLDNNGNPYQNSPAGCPLGPTGYEGPGISFSNISADQKSGTVVFNNGLAPGATAYFALEESISLNCSQITNVPDLKQFDAPWKNNTYGKSYRLNAADAGTTAVTKSQSLEFAVFANGVHQTGGKPTIYALSLTGPATLNAIRDAINGAKAGYTATVGSTTAGSKTVSQLTIAKGSENSIQLRTTAGDGTTNLFTHISAKGCYLTAVTDLVNYWGAQSTPGFVAVTPGDVNDYLNDQPNGYVGGVLPNPPAIMAYAKSLNVPLFFLGSVNHRDDLTLDTYLCGGAPTILMVGQASDSHFVVSTGKSQAGDNYLINDPGMSSTNSAYTGDLGPYGSTYIGLRLWNNDSSAPKSSFTVYAHSPVELLVIDPNSQQTGLDPASGNTPNDIPASSYDVFQLQDDDDPVNNPPTDPIKEFQVVGPADGQYRVNVIGTGDGPYSLDFLAYDVNGAESATTLSGTAHAGVTTQYVATYASGAGSTLQVVSPSISSVAPASGGQGASSLVLTLTGTNTSFSPSSRVVFSGQGVTVATASATSPTSLSATINIDTKAAMGTYSVTVTTGNEIATGTDIFTVTASAPPPSSSASGGTKGAGGAGALDGTVLALLFLVFLRVKRGAVRSICET
jgi:hypothetical protein